MSDDYRINALKAAGYDDAARLLEAMPPAVPAPPAPDSTAGAPTSTAPADDLPPLQRLEAAYGSES